MQVECGLPPRNGSPDATFLTYFEQVPVTPTRDTLERFVVGGRDGFTRVMREYGPLVRGIVNRFFTSPFEQEDAMQEIWTHAYRNRGSLDLERAEAFPGWLAVLARRRAVDIVRSRNPAAVNADNADEALGEVAVEPAQHGAVERAELARAVEGFRAALEPEWRAFFDLHFVRGVPYPLVASELGISRIRCKYMRKVLARRAVEDPDLMAALGPPAAWRRDAR